MAFKASVEALMKKLYISHIQVNRGLH